MPRRAQRPVPYHWYSAASARTVLRSRKRAAAAPTPRHAIPGVGAPVDSHGGATALCNDGTLSYNQHHQGTCSYHHDVAVLDLEGPGIGSCWVQRGETCNC
ncbi:DUF3761 domain-containing protein [Streptomyces sp. NPDC087843]|uniref:DUF3761 domain-containing protein n=1 Tax=Streptomyces sp. NPDC087843 TaxID=3365804 RepID=UPI0037F19743